MFVSHNMAAVKSLCTRGIVIENGKVVFDGGIDNAIDQYLQNREQQPYRVWEDELSPSADFIKMIKAEVKDSNEKVTFNHLTTNDIKITFSYEILKENELFTHGFNLFTTQGLHILSSHDKDSVTLTNSLQIGFHKKSIIIPKNLLAEGSYTCSFAIMRYQPFFVEFHEMDIVGFNILENKNNKSIRGEYAGRIPGVIRPLLNWE